MRTGLGQSLALREIVKSYGKLNAVQNVSFDVEPGEFMSVLGPSGSGKTTVLLSIAGFVDPTKGSIQLGGEDIVSKPPNARNIGMVFQDYALFPHMTVRENICYPLRRRKWGKTKVNEAIAEVLRLTSLDEYADRYPNQLSGGQQQRVALARAIVFEPPLLLLDEPLSALDRKLREKLQFEIKTLQRTLGVTVVFVTHDQDEALALSDRIIVMKDGSIEQIGTPSDLYYNPATHFVANFIGESNMFDAEYVGTSGSSEEPEHNCRILGHVMPVSLKWPSQNGSPTARPGTVLKTIIRPEDIRLSRNRPDVDAIPVTVSGVQFAGDRNKVETQVGGLPVYLTVPLGHGIDGENVRIGEEVYLFWDKGKAFSYAD